MNITTFDESSVDKVRKLEETINAIGDNVEIAISHTLHAGMYSRTAYLPAGVIITGALIKLPTILIVSGDVLAYTGNGAVRLTGYNVIEAGEYRKGAFVSLADTYLTMLFATDAKTVEEAEEQFTDEADNLQSRSTYNNGDKICQESSGLLP